MSNDISNVSMPEIKAMLTTLGKMVNAQPTETQPQSTTSVVEISLTEANEKWTNHMKQNDDKSKSTRKKYEQHVRLFTEWHGNGKISGIKTSDITAYRDYLLTERRIKQNSINVILVGLRQFFHYCKDFGFIDANPTLKVKRLEEAELTPRSLDDSTVNKMRNAIEIWCNSKGKFEHLMMFDFCLLCGLRGKEVRLLRFRDVEYELDEDGNECAYLTVRESKGNKYREVYMPDELLKSYKHFIANLNRSTNRDAFIFEHHGKTYGDTAMRTLYFRICRSMNLPHISPHQLRHTFAIRRINSGEKMNNLQSDLGHKSWATTSRYTLPNRNDKRKSRNL